MEIQKFPNYNSLSDRAAEIVISEIENKEGILICTATGNSPLGLYERLVTRSKGNSDFSKGLRLIGLDEWGGIPENHPITCRHFINTKLIHPLGIGSNNAIMFSSNPTDPVEECQRVQSELDKNGPVNLCILGLGKNGHLGFIEPGPYLEPHCHQAELSAESMQHSMIESADILPQYGLTLGIKDILAADKILLLISGEGKSSVTKEFLAAEITTQVPATFLWLHDNVICMIDEDTLSE